MDVWQFCTTLWSGLNAVAAELALVLIAWVLHQIRQMRKRFEAQLLQVSKAVISATYDLQDHLADLDARRDAPEPSNAPLQDVPQDKPPSQPDVKRRIWSAWKSPDAL